MKQILFGFLILAAGIYWVTKKDHASKLIDYTGSVESRSQSKISQVKEAQQATLRAEQKESFEDYGYKLTAKSAVSSEKIAKANENSSERLDFSAEDLNRLVEERKCMKCNLRGADLSGMNLERVDLSESDLSGANLHGTSLKEAKLDKAVLRNADLSEANLYQAVLKEADLSGANLSSIDLTYGDVTGANFSSANLSSANLLDLHMDKVNFSGADLTGTQASGVSLSGANWNGAILRETNLTGAKVDWSKMSQEQKCNVITDDADVLANCP